MQSHRTQQQNCTTYRPLFPVLAFVLPQDFVCSENLEIQHHHCFHKTQQVNSEHGVSVSHLVKLGKEGCTALAHVLLLSNTELNKMQSMGLIHFTWDQYKVTHTTLHTYLLSQRLTTLATGQVFPPLTNEVLQLAFQSCQFHFFNWREKTKSLYV